MKIEDLVAGKSDSDSVQVESFSIPVSALKKLMDEGYENMLPYKEEGTFSLWGKVSTACFTGQEMRDMA